MASAGSPGRSPGAAGEGTDQRRRGGRGVLGRAVTWQLRAPALPATVPALTVGTVLGRGLGTEATASGGGTVPDVVRQAHVPFGQLAAYGSGALALVLAAVGVGLLFLRTSADPDELRAG